MFGRLRDSTAAGRRRSNIRSSICARVGIFIDALALLIFPEIIIHEAFKILKIRPRKRNPARRNRCFLEFRSASILKLPELLRRASPNAHAADSPNQARPNLLQRAEIDRTPFVFADRSLARMIEPSRKRLKPRGVPRRRKSAAKVSSDDPRFLPQKADRPNKISQRKPAVLPIGDCLALLQAIEIHGHIDRKSPQRFDVSGKSRYANPGPT